MELLSNPTKHKSKVEFRKQKLANIGVNVDDIEDQEIEDLAIAKKRSPALPKLKPKPTIQDVELTFEQYGFKVNLYFTRSFIKFDIKVLTEEELETKKYKNLIESQQIRMDKLLQKLEKEMLINFAKILSLI